MSVTFALEKLFDDVVRRFGEESTNVPNYFGRREPTKQLTAESRIVWVPGDPQGALGDFGPARSIGENPRKLGNLFELFTVVISAVDPIHPENERKQYNAGRQLYDAWWRAVYLAAHGNIAIKSATWIIEKRERVSGVALRVVCTIASPVFDEAIEIAPVDVSAAIVHSSLNRDDPADELVAGEA